MQTAAGNRATQRWLRGEGRPLRRAPASVPEPETCPPPAALACLPAVDSPGDVVSTVVFPRGSARLDGSQKAELDADAAAWHASGGGVVARVDGYASAEASCEFNWRLSCERASALAAELQLPSDGSSGIPVGQIEAYAHGETAEAGGALAPNRRGTVSMPVPGPAPPPPAPPSCLPRLLGTGRVCDPKAADFQDNDFPAISASSERALAIWAAAHPSTGHLPFRSLVPSVECIAEMEAVLIPFAGLEGHNAVARFVLGSGGTVTHDATSSLGSDALTAPSFLASVAKVKRDLERELAAQAAAGALDPCALSVTPPPTYFVTSDGLALKAVIGGTQGEELFVDAFTGDVAARTYEADLRFVICDHFGVDESDLYAPGLMGFWVLQHERGGGLVYVPFINELDLPVHVSGTF